MGEHGTDSPSLKK